MVKEIIADLHAELDKDNSDTDRVDLLKEKLIALFDGVMNDGKITDQTVINGLARIRSRIEIEFRQLSP